jgi:hypothetical protein
MITPLPTPPSRQDPSNFATRADDFLGALPTFTTEANALAADVNNKQVTATNAANTATTQAGIATTQSGIATTQAGIATSAASIAINAPGTSSTSTTSLSVTIGTKSLVIQTGKAHVEGQPVLIARTSDPSGTWMTGNITAYNSGTGDLTVEVVMKEGTGTFTDWTISLTAPVGISTIEERVEVISGNTAAENFKTYVATANLTLTLPASPSTGDWVKLQNSSTVTTITIARNGSNIMSLTEDLTIDALYVAVRLVYADATRGWVFG